MAGTSRLKANFPNPFYILVVLDGTALTLTALGWLMAPYIQQKARNGPAGGGPGAGSIALAGWLDRWAATALTVEIVILIIAALLAMSTDRLFSRRRDRP